MRVDHLVHKAGLTQGDASEIEAAGHDAKADCRDLRRESELGSVNIEKVAQLAKLYATGAPPDKELRAIKERANVAGNEIADKDNGAHLVPNDWGTASGLTRDPETGGGAFNQPLPFVGDCSVGRLGARRCGRRWRDGMSSWLG